jgi:hypothetical protein
LPGALAQRVPLLPSTAFFGAQQLPEDDAVTGLLRDSSSSAIGPTAAFGVAVLAALA